MSVGEENSSKQIRQPDTANATSASADKRTRGHHTCKQANLALVGLPPWDLLEALAEALREAAFDVDEVFQRAVSCSNEFLCPVVQQSNREHVDALCTFGICTGCFRSHVMQNPDITRRLTAGYDPCRNGSYRDRFFQKYNRERTMPIKWRSLEETLNPQPVAFDVIRKLLQYIDRCDEASKSNLPAPRFCAEDGSPIFPPEGDEFELWWLTDVKRREKGEDEQKGDEDGPPSSDSEAADEGEADKEKKAADLTSDSDPDSQRSDHEPNSQQGVILPVRFDSQTTHTPYRAWAAGASASSHSIG